jgi:riboflavin kinase / FMN adenylyltransferase
VKAFKKTEITIAGRVLHGDGFGRTLGFPTANIDRRDYARKKLVIRFGVWAGKAQIGAREYKAAIVVGPIGKRGLPKLEVHLLGFRGNLYGKFLSATLTRYMRPYKSFAGAGDLIRQIKEDVMAIKKLPR